MPYNQSDYPTNGISPYGSGGPLSTISGGLADAFKMNQDQQTMDARGALLAQGQRPFDPANVATVSHDNTSLGYQISLADRLNALAEGRGPSAAQLQMQDAMSRAASSQGSLARGAASRGVGAGAAFRQAANQTAALQSQAARDAGLMRVNEQLGANQLLGGVAQGMRQAGDENWRFNAAQQNLAALQNRGMNIQALANAAGTGTTTPGIGVQAAGFLGGLFSSGAFGSRGGAGGGGGGLAGGGGFAPI